MNSFSKYCTIFAFASLVNTVALNGNEQQVQSFVANVKKNACEAWQKTTKNVSDAWEKTTGFFNEKKVKVVTKASDMKDHGWSNWSDKEKAGAVIGGTVLAATTAYVIYKLYKKFTTPKVKIKSVVR